jgi:hypothetical protein
MMKKFLQTHLPITKAIRFFTLYLHLINKIHFLYFCQKSKNIPLSYFAISAIVCCTYLPTYIHRLLKLFQTWDFGNENIPSGNPGSRSGTTSLSWGLKPGPTSASRTTTARTAGLSSGSASVKTCTNSDTFPEAGSDPFRSPFFKS